MDEQKQEDQLETIYYSSVLIQDVALKTYRKRWKIEKGGGRESGISVLMVRDDDDDDDMSRRFSEVSQLECSGLRVGDSCV